MVGSAWYAAGLCFDEPSPGLQKDTSLNMATQFQPPGKQAREFRRHEKWFVPIMGVFPGNGLVVNPACVAERLRITATSRSNRILIKLLS